MNNALCLFVLALTVSSCAPTSIQTPQGHTAYTSDQIVIRVNELQNAAIAANSAGSLPESTTRIIVTFAVNADRILAATPQGWQATIALAWGQAKAQLPPIANPAIQAAISAVDVVLAAFGGAQ